MNYFNLLYNGQYDQLVKETFPLLDKESNATCAFLRLFLQKTPVVLLDFDTSIEPLIQEAKAGNRYAQYAYARWQSLVCGEENSLNISYRYMKAAAEQNLPDAIAAFAMTYEFGDIGIVDWEKYDELIEQSVALGSELGKTYMLRDLCFGKNFTNAQPDKAAALANEFINQDEHKGIEPNGLWFYYRATANEAKLGRTQVIDDYRRALDLGVLSAFTDLIIAYGYGDSLDNLTETKEYSNCLLQGIARLAPNALILDADREMRHYDTLKKRLGYDGFKKHPIQYKILHASHELIFSRLSHAAELCDNAAWEQLGDMYYDGTYGFEQNYDKAFVAYSNGVIHNSASCAEKLWQMMHDHIIDRPLDYQDSIAIEGARCGSIRLLAETVIIHQQGRLSEYADEIEKYYEPIFDAPDFNLGEAWDEDYLDENEKDENDGKYDAWA
ncbi:MAG: hypothetical protein IJ834_05225 [Paludibacteraceae bacterium]|nr:hypothetical protein [Paludibacteraceae bacterium]